MQATMAAKMETTIRKFDPEEHKENTLEAFQDFVDSYKYEYEAIAREPPEELETDALKKGMDGAKQKEDLPWQIFFTEHATSIRRSDYGRGANSSMKRRR